MCPSRQACQPSSINQGKRNSSYCSKYLSHAPLAKSIRLQEVISNARPSDLTEWLSSPHVQAFDSSCQLPPRPSTNGIDSAPGEVAELQRGLAHQHLVLLVQLGHCLKPNSRTKKLLFAAGARACEGKNKTARKHKREHESFAKLS